MEIDNFNQPQSLIGAVETKTNAVIREVDYDGSLDGFLGRVREFKPAIGARLLLEFCAYFMERCTQLCLLYNHVSP